MDIRTILEAVLVIVVILVAAWLMTPQLPRALAGAPHRDARAALGAQALLVDVVAAAAARPAPGERPDPEVAISVLTRALEDARLDEPSRDAVRVVRIAYERARQQGQGGA